MNKNYSGRDFSGQSFKDRSEDFRDANFQSAKLQGANFEGLNLSGAVFTHADLRGVNFRNAILNTTDFSYAKMGLNFQFMVVIGSLALFFTLLTLPITLLAGTVIGSTTYMYGKIGAVFGLTTFLIFCFIFILRGTDVALRASIYSIPLITALTAFSGLLISRHETQDFATVIVSVVVSISCGIIPIWNSIANAIIFIYIRAVFGKISANVIGIVLLFTIFLVIINILFASYYGMVVSGDKIPNNFSHFEITNNSLRRLEMEGIPGEIIDKLEKLQNREYSSEEKLVTALQREVGKEQALEYKLEIVESARTFRGSIADVGFGAFFAAAIVDTLIISLSFYAAWRAITKEKKHSFILNLATKFASIGGTSFENADLSDAYFEGVTLRNTNFSGANHTQTCYWTSAKDLEFARELIPFRE